jgi:hypothetical protein
MRRFIGLSVLAAGVVFLTGSQKANAGITGITKLWDSGDANAIPSTNYQTGTDSTSVEVTATGTQTGGASDGLTGTADGDPNLFIFNSFNNDTAFTWTSYNVSVELPVADLTGPFTIGNFAWFGTPTPAAWSPPVLDGLEFINGAGQYEQDLTYTGAANLPPGGTFSFGYELSFVTSNPGAFAFTQVLTPVPEPASFGVLTLGGLGILARRRRSRLA